MIKSHGSLLIRAEKRGRGSLSWKGKWEKIEEEWVLRACVQRLT